MTLKDYLLRFIHTLPDENKVDLYNEYAKIKTLNPIFRMSEINDIIKGKASDILKEVSDRDFHINDKYFTYVEEDKQYYSFTYWEETYSFSLHIDMDVVTDYMFETGDGILPSVQLFIDTYNINYDYIKEKLDDGFYENELIDLMEWDDRTETYNFSESKKEVYRVLYNLFEKDESVDRNYLPIILDVLVDDLFEESEEANQAIS